MISLVSKTVDSYTSLRQYYESIATQKQKEQLDCAQKVKLVEELQIQLEKLKESQTRQMQSKAILMAVVQESRRQLTLRNNLLNKSELDSKIVQQHLSSLRFNQNAGSCVSKVIEETLKKDEDLLNNLLDECKNFKTRATRFCHFYKEFPEIIQKENMQKMQDRKNSLVSILQQLSSETTLKEIQTYINEANEPQVTLVLEDLMLKYQDALSLPSFTFSELDEEASAEDILAECQHLQDSIDILLQKDLDEFRETFEDQRSSLAMLISSVEEIISENSRIKNLVVVLQNQFAEENKISEDMQRILDYVRTVKCWLQCDGEEQPEPSSSKLSELDTLFKETVELCRRRMKEWTDLCSQHKQLKSQSTELLQRLASKKANLQNMQEQSLTLQAVVLAANNQAMQATSITDKLVVDEPVVALDLAVDEDVEVDIRTLGAAAQEEVQSFIDEQTVRFKLLSEQIQHTTAQKLAELEISINSKKQKRYQEVLTYEKQIAALEDALQQPITCLNSLDPNISNEGTHVQIKTEQITHSTFDPSQKLQESNENQNTTTIINSTSTAQSSVSPIRTSSNISSTQESSKNPFSHLS